MAGQNIQRRSAQELVVIHNTSKCKRSVKNPGSTILVIKYAIKITSNTILDKMYSFFPNVHYKSICLLKIFDE